MKKKIIFLLLIAGICMSSYAQTVIDNPAFVRNNNPGIVKITKIELLSDATVLHITAINPPNLWVKFSSQTELKDANSTRRYKLLKCDGYPLDKEHYMKKGRQDFKMYFKPLDPDVTKIDFVEGYERGAFRIWGITVRDTVVLENLAPTPPTVNIVASPGQTIIIPAKTMKKWDKNQDLVIKISDK